MMLGFWTFCDRKCCMLNDTEFIAGLFYELWQSVNDCCNLCLPSLPFTCRRSTLFEGWKDTISGQVWLPRCYGFPGTSVSAHIVMLSLRP